MKTPILSTLTAALALTVGGCAVDAQNTACPHRDESVCLTSLAQLSIEQLRQRDYHATLNLIEKVQPAPLENAETYLAGYKSDGLRIYTRIDLPTQPAPASGFPVVIFSHGWIGIDKAPDYRFGLDKDSFYGELVQQLTAAGFAVLSPGFRGHGTVDGAPADGRSFMQAWDNSSYLSPSFYAIDLVNLLAATPKIGALDWSQWRKAAPKLNPDRINLLGHSQGGDAALTALAITGNNPRTGSFHAASIWSGNIPDKFTQANTFGPMASTPAAFVAGDGSWTGTATGQDGSVNPDFVFGFPPDWIGNPDPISGGWTWQHNNWSTTSMDEALQAKYQQMYETINRYTLNIDDAEFTIARDSEGKLVVEHDPRVQQGLAAASAYPGATTIHTPLALHFSDRDYYSLPEWNFTLQKNITRAGGHAFAFEYPGTTHSLKVSEQLWFSPAGTQAGVPCALARDQLLFTGQQPDQHNCKQPRKNTEAPQ